MITTEMLMRWSKAKDLAITSTVMEQESIIAMQEMFIECKNLRLKNFRLLEAQEVLDSLAEYVRIARRDHYITPLMEDLYERIQESSEHFNITLELHDEH